jgi:hypothetical protein
VSALALAAFAGSCAFGDRHVKLVYPPDTSGNVVEAAAVRADAPVVFLAPIADKRAEKKFVGEVRNGFGAHTADVIADSDVVAWVQGALQREFESAGFKVVTQPPTGSATTVRTELVTVFCTALMSYEGEVSLLVAIERDGKALPPQRYTGKGSSGTNWGATSESYVLSLAVAMQSAAQQLVAAVKAAPPQP